MRGAEVLDPQPGNHGLLKTAELPGQERRRFTGRQAAARLQQIEDSADWQLPNGPGILRPGYPQLVYAVRPGQQDNRIGLTALPCFPQSP